MKTLRSISTAVLLCLALAAPAAASTVTVTVSNPSPTLGTTVNYHVSGEAEVTQMYEVRMMTVEAARPASECEDARTSSHKVFEAEVHGSSLHLNSFEHEGVLALEDYNTPGSYTVCAIVREGRGANAGTFSANLTGFTVVSAPVESPPSESSKSKSTETPEAPAPTPSNPGPAGPQGPAGASATTSVAPPGSCSCCA